MTRMMSPGTAETELATIVQAYNDVTERLKQSHDLLAREVCQLRVEVHEKNLELARRERLAALGEMAAGVAHEIRNPLGGIGLYASVLERDLMPQSEQQTIARRIGEGVRHMESIVGDILAFAGGGEVARERHRLGDILDVVLLQSAPHAEAAGALIEVDKDLQRVQVFCDARQIQRAISNLVFNALEASGEDGHVWIRAGVHPRDAEAFPLVVEDDGPGIAKELMQRVFHPFFTTKDTGTGLGLAIVHAIVEAHGGRVTAGWREGGGAAFTLWLPTGDDAKALDAGGTV